MAHHTHAHACRGGATAAALGIAALTLTACSTHASVSAGSATPAHSSSSTQASSDGTSTSDSSTDSPSPTDSTSPTGSDSTSSADASGSARTVHADELSALAEKQFAGRAPSGSVAHCPDLEGRVGASVRCWWSLPDGRTMGTTATVTHVDPAKADGIQVELENDQDYTPAPSSS